MEKEKIISSGILEQYVLGLTSPEENREIEQAISRYPEVKAYLKMIEEDVSQYSLAQGIPRSKSQRKLQRKSMIINTVSILLFIALAAVNWYLFDSRNDALQQVRLLEQELYLLKEENRELRENSQITNNQTAFLRHISTRQLELKRDSGVANMIIYWNDQLKNAFLRFAKVPPPPKNHQYQLWANVNGNYQSIGLLESLTDTGQLYKIKYIDSCKGIIVSIEDMGGAKIYTPGHMYANVAF